MSSRSCCKSTRSLHVTNYKRVSVLWADNRTKWKLNAARSLLSQEDEKDGERGEKIHQSKRKKCAVTRVNGVKAKTCTDCRSVGEGRFQRQTGEERVCVEWGREVGWKEEHSRVPATWWPQELFLFAFINFAIILLWYRVLGPAGFAAKLIQCGDCRKLGFAGGDGTLTQRWAAARGRWYRIEFSRFSRLLSMALGGREEGDVLWGCVEYESDYNTSLQTRDKLVTTIGRQHHSSDLSESLITPKIISFPRPTRKEQILHTNSVTDTLSLNTANIVPTKKNKQI